MLSFEKPDTKAFHELILYYFRERIENINNEIKYLIATNIYEWFIIDANEFDKKIYKNTPIKKLYEIKKTDNKDNPWFYDEVKKASEKQESLSLETTYFDIRKFEKVKLMLLVLLVLLIPIGLIYLLILDS